MKDIVIYGAGGLGSEIEFLIKRINKTIIKDEDKWNLVGYVVTTYREKEPSKIIGDERWLFENCMYENLYIALGIGDAKARYEIGNRLLKSIKSSERFPVLIDPSVIYDDSCIFDPGVIIAAGTVLTVNVTMDNFSFLNLNCTVGHGAYIGQGVVVNPSVNISGNVNINRGSLVGTGAQILQNLNIDEFVQVGAGAVVTKDVNFNKTVVGIPAKEIKQREK